MERVQTLVRIEWCGSNQTDVECAGCVARMGRTFAAYTVTVSGERENSVSRRRRHPWRRFRGVDA